MIGYFNDNEIFNVIEDLLILNSKLQSEEDDYLNNWLSIGIPDGEDNETDLLDYPIVALEDWLNIARDLLYMRYGLLQ